VAVANTFCTAAEFAAVVEVAVSGVAVVAAAVSAAAGTASMEMADITDNIRNRNFFFFIMKSLFSA
jgi:hypothetical protein